MQHDFLGDVLAPGGVCWGNQFDICTFGFEVSLDLLRAKQATFKKDAHLIVPLSRRDFAQEQDFKVLRYRGNDEFDVLEDIMRTSFAMRIDKKLIEDASLDADYFNNMQRISKLQMFEDRVKELE
mmetsp:Transcript_1774/g.2509  ORF Transcript_1774/g.2509 Transcript_1774/m.2509 type:complete len:125 (+) Transcript_1774:573-947(+)